MKSWVLAATVIVIITFAGLAGYFAGVNSVSAPKTRQTTVYSTATTTLTSKVNQTEGYLNSNDRFTIFSLHMFFAQVAGCSDCGNVSIVIRNTGSTPITGVNMSFGSWFLGPIWSASIASMSPFPLLAGNSIVGFDGNSEVPNESNTFLVTAMFADGNATTESYDWPGGSQAVVRVQPYCCLDPSFNASSPCPTEFNSSIYNRLETLVTANPEFIALENGKNFTNPNGSFCGQSYNHYDVGVAFYHITDQLFLYCGNLQNVTDYISADLLRTPSGYSLSSMLLQTSNSTTNAQMCTTTVSPSTASTSD